MLNNHGKSQEEFDKVFAGLLKSNKPKEPVKDKDAEEKEKLKPISEALFGEEEQCEITEKDWETFCQEYIPESIMDEQWEEFASRPPVPPLNREQEARAVSLGLQEIRKMREYMFNTDNHMMSGFNSNYATYSLLIQKDFEEHVKEARMKTVKMMENMEHLIAGDIDRVSSVQEDFKLFQKFEEERLRVLHCILEHYNRNKK